MTGKIIPSFAQRLLLWWKQHGRHDLPWQQQRTPYRVWLSEVMLQQTQVSTVIPYYQRFIDRFPDLASLARAQEDDVLALWSGLGYYSRGRNLHRCAQLCMSEHQGELPADVKTLTELPGIGSSTARAIISQAHNQVHAILDGNVKRVMARHAGISGWPGQSSVQRELWQAAESRLPKPDSGRGADYTQAIMDLGATCCTPRQAQCHVCPVASDCQALARGLVNQLPARRPRAALPQRSAVFLLLHQADGQIWLQRRPGQGIWAGLWCLPQFEDVASAQLWLDQAWPHLSSSKKAFVQLSETPHWAQFKHVFTHFKLNAQVYALECSTPGVTNGAAENDAGIWHGLDAALALGLPQPIRRLLENLEPHDLFGLKPPSV